MFRRVSIIPRSVRVVSSRLFSDHKSVYDKEGTSKSTVATKVRRFFDVALILLVTSNVVFGWYINKIFHARQYVTDADFDEYRSQPRNFFEEKSDTEARKALLRCGKDIDKKVEELAKERKPKLSAEIVTARDKEASERFWAYIWGNFTFNTAARARNWDNYLSFYCTYTERVELERRGLEAVKVVTEKESKKSDA